MTARGCIPKPDHIRSHLFRQHVYRTVSYVLAQPEPSAKTTKKRAGLGKIPDQVEQQVGVQRIRSSNLRSGVSVQPVCRGVEPREKNIPPSVDDRLLQLPGCARRAPVAHPVLLRGE